MSLKATNIYIVESYCEECSSDASLLIKYIESADFSSGYAVIDYRNMKYAFFNDEFIESGRVGFEFDEERQEVKDIKILKFIRNIYELFYKMIGNDTKYMIDFSDMIKEDE